MRDKVIGIYDRTVVLTFCSVFCAAIGIIVSCSGPGHQYIGILCLLICGLCDAFDGRVARMKEDRSQRERDFGIQIDSLSDLVAFGVLPTCIGAAMYRKMLLFSQGNPDALCITMYIPYWLVVILFACFVLTALIRLAFFNVTEEELQGGNKKRVYYHGLPVTASALIFPTIVLVQFLFRGTDLFFLYYLGMLVTGAAFVANFRFYKPSLKVILFMVGFGALEFATIVLLRFFVFHG